jgi:hypothetical protein
VSGGVVNFGSFLFGFCAPQGRSVLGFKSFFGVLYGREVDPPSFVFGGSNFLVRNLPFSPLGYLVLSNAR